MEDQNTIIDERIMTNYDFDETALSQTIDITAFCFYFVGYKLIKILYAFLFFINFL